MNSSKSPWIRPQDSFNSRDRFRLSEASATMNTSASGEDEPMDYAEFTEKAREACGHASWEISLIRNEDVKKLAEANELFIVTWVSGGTAGGNCWGPGGHYSIESDREPEMDALINVLEESGISLKEARQVFELIQHGTFGESGYYGNYTDYGYKWISFAAAYDKLVEFGKAEPRADAPAP